MNHAHIFCIILACLPTTVYAESIYERDLKQLTEKRDKDLASAAQQINHSYQSELEKLLPRATQSKDVQAITAIAEALKAIGVTAKTPAITDSSALPVATRIENLLTSKVWLHLGRFHYKFTKDGRIYVQEKDLKGTFKIDGKTGFVSFRFEKNQYPGAGIAFHEATETFTHATGDPFVPVEK